MAPSNILLETGTNELELVEFFIDELGENGEQKRNYYGMNVAKVLEIIRMPDGVAPMPDMHHHAVLGAFDQRGRLIPLIDLATWLSKDSVPTDDPRVIVCEFNKTTTAFMVSGVTRIHRLSWDQVEPPEPHVAAMTKNNITGVVRMANHLLLILDMEKIVGDINPESRMEVTGRNLVEEYNLKKHYRALIADDSSAIRSTMVAVLKKAGFSVIATNNGREAWDKLKDIRTKVETESLPLSDFVDVVITDIEMPAMDGHTLCRSIKEDRCLRTLPVLLFSSLITDKLQHKGASVGADGQISKPEISKVAERALELILDENRVIISPESLGI